MVRWALALHVGGASLLFSLGDFLLLLNLSLHILPSSFKLAEPNAPFCLL